MDETLDMTTTETAETEATTPVSEEVNTQQPAVETEPDAQPEAEGEAQTAESPNAEDSAQPGEDDHAPAFTIPVKYNKQYRELTPDEASAYAQKGLKYEELEPQLSKLRFLGQRTGQSLDAILDGVYQAAERIDLQRIRDKVGDDEALIKQLVDARNLSQKSAYDAMLEAERKAEMSEREDNNKRLADEFAALHAEFPGLSKIDDVPKAVMQDALRTGRDLLSAYLLHTHQETRRIQQAQAQQDAAAKASTGSQAGGDAAAESPEIAAMRVGVWR